MPWSTSRPICAACSASSASSPSSFTPTGSTTAPSSARRESPTASAKSSAWPPDQLLQRPHCIGAVVVDHRVELVGEDRLEIVALALAVRRVDHSDGALQHLLAELPLE